MKGIFGMLFVQAKYLERFIKSKNLSNLLELGFAHGVSSCYMANILNECGEGHLISVSRRKPNIEGCLIVRFTRICICLLWVWIL